MQFVKLKEIDYKQNHFNFFNKTSLRMFKYVVVAWYVLHISLNTHQRRGRLENAADLKWAVSNWPVWFTVSQTRPDAAGMNAVLSQDVRGVGGCWGCHDLGGMGGLEGSEGTAGRERRIPRAARAVAGRWLARDLSSPPLRITGPSSLQSYTTAAHVWQLHGNKKTNTCLQSSTKLV